MKKILALVLMMLLVFGSFPITAFASEPGEADIPLEIEEDAGIPLEMEEIDPSTLHVKKLGLIEEDEAPEIEEMTYQPGDIVRVSIFLDGDSVADAGYSLDGVGYSEDAISYRDQLKKQQAAVINKIESAIKKDLDVKWNLTLLTNAISAEVVFSDIVKIERVKGVKSIYIENMYTAEESVETDGTRTANTYKDMVGAAAAWDMGYTGAGQLIAIIDTGIDTSHQSFSASAFEYSLGRLSKYPDLLTRSEVNALKNQLNGSGGAYVNSKVPFGFNYSDGNTDIAHYGTNGQHGSHVAGIAAANRFVKIGSSYIDAVSSVNAVGMAPDAQLLIMKVFGTDGVAYESDFISAIEDAIVLGADAVNMSLGSNEPGFTYMPDYQEVFNNLSKGEYNSKAVVSVSIGNSSSVGQHLYNGLRKQDVSMHTGGAPGTYINGLSVASADNIGANGSSAARSDAVISDFSSWGVPGSLIMKPEITAPGGAIYSVNGYNVSQTATTGGHDQYTYMSGTSMAAPHVAGLAALTAEYIEDSNLRAKNIYLANSYSIRAIDQSLLMSTATPMKKDNNYYSILQQGAGLIDVLRAVGSASVVMIDPDSDDLTAKTGAAEDGKVKVEFGDDPDKTGVYEYSFTIYNLADQDLRFELDTEVFTQDLSQRMYLSETTIRIDTNVTYFWDTVGYSGESHDVNLDGETDRKDAQAILDHISAKFSANEIDAEAGDLDKDGKLSSLDAHILLDQITNGCEYEDGIVPANGKRSVTVSISVNNKASMESNYPSGFYVEGFTYITCEDVIEDISYVHQHSIPFLGFYGNWTEARMFDYTDTNYSYSGNVNTNYMTIISDGKSVKYDGKNPYSAGNLSSNKYALNSATVINSMKYTLMRAAGTQVSCTACRFFYHLSQGNK